MADEEITKLPELINAAAADVLPIVADPAGGRITKKITVANLLVGPGGVSSVFGRAGAVVATIGDYAAVAETFSVLQTFSAANAVAIVNTLPLFSIQDTDAAADEGNWLWRVTDGDLVISTAADATPFTQGPQAISFIRGTGSVFSHFQFGGPFLMAEIAAAVGDISAFGQFWVRDDTPNIPMFTDDAGTDFELNLSGGDVTKVGTPVDNQLGVWTGDGTIEGDAKLTWDGGTLKFPTIIPNEILLDMGGVGSASTNWEIWRSTDNVAATFWRLLDDHSLSSANHRLSWQNDLSQKFIEFDRSGELRFGGTEAAEKMFIDINANKVSVRNGATFYIEEVAAALADLGGEGQFWVRNDTPNTAMFTDDTGIDFVLNPPVSAAYTRDAVIVEDRTLLASASATTINNNNVLAALIADLQTAGFLG